MSNKRGQIALIIIIALVIVIAVILILQLTGKNKAEKTEKISLRYLDECFKQKLDLGVRVIGYSGGYYVNESSLRINGWNIPYYYKDNKKSIPSKETVEKQFEIFMEERFPLCVDDFKEKYPEWNISYKDFVVDVKISEDKLVASSKSKIQLSKEDNSYFSDEFNAEFKINLLKMLKASDEIVDSLDTEYYTICVECLDRISSTYNIGITATPSEEVQIILFNLIDSSVKDYPYTYQFIMEYRPNSTKMENFIFDFLRNIENE